jgi:SAM-dependent methyltransferase
MNHPNWNEYWRRYRPFNHKKLVRSYERFGIDSMPRDSRILDLGCGSGEFIKILIERGFTNVEGLEPQADLVKIAGLPSITQGDCLAEPRNPSAYDAVIISGVLHHLLSFDEVLTALKNVRTLLRPGGYFFSMEPRQTIARRVATKLMLTLPRWTLPEKVKLERIFTEEETVELNRWLGFERQVLPRAVALGLKVKLLDFDWKSAYMVLSKT